jgi:hypothetical protein
MSICKVCGNPIYNSDANICSTKCASEDSPQSASSSSGKSPFAIFETLGKLGTQPLQYIENKGQAMIKLKHNSRSNFTVMSGDTAFCFNGRGEAETTSVTAQVDAESLMRRNPGQYSFMEGSILQKNDPRKLNVPFKPVRKPRPDKTIPAPPKVEVKVEEAKVEHKQDTHHHTHHHDKKPGRPFGSKKDENILAKSESEKLDLITEDKS